MFDVTNLFRGPVHIARYFGVYTVLYEPRKIGVETADQLFPQLSEACDKLADSNHKFFKGELSYQSRKDYSELVHHASGLLAECVRHPSAKVVVNDDRPITLDLAA